MYTIQEMWHMSKNLVFRKTRKTQSTSYNFSQSTLFSLFKPGQHMEFFSNEDSSSGGKGEVLSSGIFFIE